MSVTTGSTPVQDLFAGSTQIQNVYVGSTQIYTYSPYIVHYRRTSGCVIDSDQIMTRGSIWVEQSPLPFTSSNSVDIVFRLKAGGKTSSYAGYEELLKWAINAQGYDWNVFMLYNNGSSYTFHLGGHQDPATPNFDGHNWYWFNIKSNGTYYSNSFILDNNYTRDTLPSSGWTDVFTYSDQKATDIISNATMFGLTCGDSNWYENRELDLKSFKERVSGFTLADPI